MFYQQNIWQLFAFESKDEINYKQENNKKIANRKMRRKSSQQIAHPFKQTRNDILLTKQLQSWYLNEEQTTSIRILSHPMSQRHTLTMLYFFISKLCKEIRQLSMCILLDTKSRANFMLEYAQCIVDRYFENSGFSNIPLLTSAYVANRDGRSQIVFSTFKSFAQVDLKNESVYHGLVIETANFSRIVKDGFSDYLTDTYLRRAYIQSIKLMNAFKQPPKQPIPPPPLKKKLQSDLQLICLSSRQPSSYCQKQKKQEQPVQYYANKLKTTFELKCVRLLNKKSRGQKGEEKPIFQTNQLVLLSTMIYIIGFLNHQMQIKKIRDIREFLHDFENKTEIGLGFLENIMGYMLQIYSKCPVKIYERMEDMYLYNICLFLYKVVNYRNIFPDHYHELFQIVRPDRIQPDRREQSTSWLAISCKDNNKICLKAIQQKSLNTMIIQNLACPQQYWQYIFKKKNMLIHPTQRTNKFSKLYGLHISKTPSNEDLNFAQKSRADIETIKIKACGVLLHDLSKFIPDGIVVYFYSFQGMETFVKELDRDDQRILKRIENNKKIFFQSIFQEENNVSFEKFRKCCEIGRGAIFILSANGKAAQNLKFPQHLSRSIVFFGLPRREQEIRREYEMRQQTQAGEEKRLELLQHQNMEKINIINECVNNCIDRESDYKSVIFVGAQITSDLSKWYQSFIRSWDETTRDSLVKLRSYYQKMGKQDFQINK